MRTGRDGTCQPPHPVTGRCALPAGATLSPSGSDVQVQHDSRECAILGLNISERSQAGRAECPSAPRCKRKPPQAARRDVAAGRHRPRRCAASSVGRSTPPSGAGRLIPPGPAGDVGVRGWCAQTSMGPAPTQSAALTALWRLRRRIREAPIRSPWIASRRSVGRHRSHTRRTWSREVSGPTVPQVRQRTLPAAGRHLVGPVRPGVHRRVARPFACQACGAALLASCRAREGPMGSRTLGP